MDWLQKMENAQAMAYVGYCFNRKHLPEAAILWYERAIKKGAAAGSIYNNLAASYIDAHPQLPRLEQVRRTEFYLEKALTSDPESIVVQLNLVRLARFEFQWDRQSDPSRVWAHAYAVLAAKPGNVPIEQEVNAWYRSVLSAIADSKRSLPISSDATNAWKAFGALNRMMDDPKTQLGSSQNRVSHF